MADVVNVLARRARPGWARWAFDRKGETWQLRHAEISWGRSLPVIKLEYGSIATSCWSSRKQPFHRSQLRSRVRRFASDAAPYGRLLSITRPSECDCKATLTMADIGYRGPSPGTRSLDKTRPVRTPATTRLSVWTRPRLPTTKPHCPRFCAHKLKETRGNPQVS